MFGVQIRLSGAIEVERDGEPVRLPGRRARALLTCLALEAGHRVSSDELVLRVWRDEAPANPRASLHTNIARLRRLLGEDRVVRQTDGYLLVVDRAQVDLLAFQDALDGVEAGSGEEREALEKALDLWRGTPFGGELAENGGEQLAAPWQERYLSAYERLVDLDVADGRGTGHLPHLRDLVDQHPLRETLWVRLLTVLQQDGRLAEALERYDAVRRHLADELGADPSTELQAIHARLLDADTGPTPRRAMPHMLPGDVDGFTGRSAELADLDSAADSGVRIVAVHGPGGVGKTSLVIHWARHRRDLFPDGELFVDLRGYGPGSAAGVLEALDQMLRAIGVPGAEIPGDEAGRAALLRGRMADRRMLVLLDNARDAAQVRPLLPGGESLVVVTSRSQLRSLVSRSGARRVQVDPMSEADAIALLQNRIGPVDGDEAARLTELAERCGRLPVALAVAAERAGREGEVRLSAVLDRLRDDQARIATLTDWDDDPLTGVREVFAWSYELLEAETARMFRLLGLMPDSVVSTGAAGALAGVDLTAAERVLDRLTDAHLVQESSPGWYVLHDLARAYAGEVVADAEPARRAAAERRLRSWYVHSARHAGATIRPPTTEPDPPAVEDGVTPVVFGRDVRATDRAMAWFEEHQRSIRAVFDAAVADHDHGVVVALALSEGSYLRDTVVALVEAGQMARLAYRSAEELGDPVTVAVCATRLGLWAAESGDDDGAMAHLTRARDLFTATGHQVGRLTAEMNICVLLARLDQLETAMKQLQRAVDAEPFSMEAAHVHVRMENNLADGFLQLGRLDDALATATTAVEHARQVPGLDVDLATALITLGEIHQAAAEWSRSIEVLEEAHGWCSRSGSRRFEIIVLKLLGLAHRELGEPGLARRRWEEAVRLLAGSDVLRAYGVSSQDLQQLLDALPSPT